MHLTLFLTILLLLAWQVRFSIAILIAPWVSELHLGCLNWLPANTSSLPEMQALVCGGNFTTFEASQLYVSTGLIHLFVVSGAHLLVIHKIIDFPLRFLESTFDWRVWIRPWVSLSLLVFYAGVCDLNPPVTRSLIAIILANSFFVGPHFWPTPFKVLIAGLLTLLVNPLWVTSLSFQLSWLIALSLSVNAEFFRESPALIRQSLNYILIFPTLLLFQFPNPLTILMNVIFAPFLELILFPLALVTSIFPLLIPLFDFLIRLLKKILAWTEMGITPQVLEKSDLFLLANWAFIFFIHLCLHFYHIQQERKKSCSVFAPNC